MTKTPHPFEAVTVPIAHTIDRDGLIDWLSWKNPEADYKSIPEDELTREDALRLVERMLKQKK